MIKLAIIDETLNAQIITNKEDTQNLEIIYKENNLNDFLSKSHLLNPKVLIIDLKYLEESPNPKEKLDEIINISKVELCIIVYNFSKKDVIQSLETKNSKTVRKPVTLRALKVHLLGLILEEISKERIKREENATPLTNYNISDSNNNIFSTSFKTDIKYIISRLNSLESYSESSNQEKKNLYNMISLEMKKAKNIMTNALEKI